MEERGPKLTLLMTSLPDTHKNGIFQAELCIVHNCNFAKRAEALTTVVTETHLSIDAALQRKPPLPCCPFAITHLEYNATVKLFLHTISGHKSSGFSSVTDPATRRLMWQLDYGQRSGERGGTEPPQRFENHSSAGGHAIRGKEVLELPQSPEPFLKDQQEWVSLNGSHWANELLHLDSNPELKLISTQPEEINQENKQAALDIH